MDLLDAGQVIMGPIGFACLLAGWKALDRLACCCLHRQWVVLPLMRMLMLLLRVCCLA